MMKKEPFQTNSLSEQIKILNKLIKHLKKAQGIKDKINILEKFFHFDVPANFLLDKGKKELIFKSLAALGQADHLFHGINWRRISKKRIEELIELLYEIELFYAPIGGLIGYHHELLKLLSLKKEKVKTAINYEKPEGIDLSKENNETRLAVKSGIEYLSEICEIYPLAGAGDRLNLHDETTKEALPAAELRFLGRTLLESLIRDLQGREYLYYKLMGKQAKTPIVLMTSLEKENDRHIRAILEKNGWFLRSKKLFFLMLQQSAPLITKEGLWAISAPLKPLLKPGGHGVLWKLALDSGAIDWLKSMGREKALIRQINNPIAGVDNGLLALSGIGCYYKKIFGFASCPRALNTAEGMDVLIEKKTKKGYEYSITNLEYTEFEKLGIKDHPATPNGKYSLYPSNTNILFVNLKPLSKLIQKMPIPGMVLNMKSRTECFTLGQIANAEVGRLESTMQNIADIIVTTSRKKLSRSEKKNHLKTFITYNSRNKTISVTKKLFTNQTALHETPEGAFFDLLLNAYDLFKNYLGFKMPKMASEKRYLEKGPSFMIQYHPALGPLYSVISQKIQRGKIAEGSELYLEIAELEIQNLHLNGSLLIKAISPLGHLHQNKTLLYSENGGKCSLKNVKVINQGVDYSKSAPFWKQQVVRKEALEIILEGNGEFSAEDLIFEGSRKIIVPNNQHVTAFMKNGELLFISKEIKKPTWHWSYSFQKDNSILIKKITKD